MPAITDNALFPAQCSDRMSMKQWVIISIGAAGAATVLFSSAGFTAVLNGAGTYDLAFRPSPLAGYPKVVLKSAAKTVVTSVVTAFTPSSGTATIKTLAGVNAAVDTNPANGDVVYVEIESFGNLAQ